MNLNLNTTVTKKLCNKSGCIGGQAFENETNGLLYCCPEHADWSGFQKKKKKKKKKFPPGKRHVAAKVIQAAIRDYLEWRSSYCENCDDDEQWLECWSCHKRIRINSEEHDNAKICEFSEGDVLFCIDCREYCDTSSEDDSDDE